MKVRLKEIRKFKVMEFSTGEYKPVTITPNRILDIEFIDDNVILESKEDEALHEFLSNYKGYYWIKSDLFDCSKYCCDDADPFLLSEGEFDEVN